MSLAETREAICTAIGNVTPTIDGGTRFTRFTQTMQAFVEAASSKRRLYQIRMDGAPRVSRWTLSNGRDVMEALLVVDVAYPVSGWTRHNGADDALAGDTASLITAIGAPAVWSTKARNVSVRPEPVVDVITGEGGSLLARVLSISVLVEYST